MNQDRFERGLRILEAAQGAAPRGASNKAPPRSARTLDTSHSQATHLAAPLCIAGLTRVSDIVIHKMLVDDPDVLRRTHHGRLAGAHRELGPRQDHDDPSAVRDTSPRPAASQALPARPTIAIDVPGYREIPPPSALGDVVACLWVRVAGIAGEVRVVPDGCVDVVWQQGAGVRIAGPDTTAKLVARAQNDLLVGMRFLPGAGGGALGVPLDALRDLSVDVADVDRELDLDGDLAPGEVVARFVFAAASRRADPLVVEAARRIDRTGVRAVARDLWVSERQLLRRFHAAVGYGPKTLARVLRFQRFVSAVDGGRRDLAALALEAGYADQAHLTREVTRLAGVPPLALIRDRGVTRANAAAIAGRPR